MTFPLHILTMLASLEREFVSYLVSEVFFVVLRLVVRLGFRRGYLLVTCEFYIWIMVVSGLYVVGIFC